MTSNVRLEEVERSVLGKNPVSNKKLVKPIIGKS